MNTNILTSQKNTFVYIEHCAVSVSEQQLCFKKSKNGKIKYYAIPYGNLAILILGPGTSLTQQAARYIASEKMLVAFSSGNMGNLYLTAENEYRNPIYLQKWYELWINSSSRLDAAKIFFKKRFDNNIKFWNKINNKVIFESSKKLNISDLEELNYKYFNLINNSLDTKELLGYEANYVKQIYILLATHFKISNFKREHDSQDLVNSFLNKSNYLSYGIANTVIWTLGIPSSFALFHGKTRKGGLVFDLADTIKDSITLPLSFLAANSNLTNSDLRKLILDIFEDFEVLQNLFLTMKETLLHFDKNLHFD